MHHRAFFLSRFDLEKKGGMSYGKKSGSGKSKGSERTVKDYQLTHLDPETFSLDNTRGQVSVERDGLYKLEYTMSTDYRQLFLNKRGRKMFAR